MTIDCSCGSVNWSVSIEQMKREKKETTFSSMKNRSNEGKVNGATKVTQQNLFPFRRTFLCFVLTRTLLIIMEIIFFHFDVFFFAMDSHFFWSSILDPSISSERHTQKKTHLPCNDLISRGVFSPTSSFWCLATRHFTWIRMDYSSALKKLPHLKANQSWNKKPNEHR